MFIVREGKIFEKNIKKLKIPKKIGFVIDTERMNEIQLLKIIFWSQNLGIKDLIFYDPLNSFSNKEFLKIFEKKFTKLMKKDIIYEINYINKTISFSEEKSNIEITIYFFNYIDTHFIFFQKDNFLEIERKILRNDKIKTKSECVYFTRRCLSNPELIINFNEKENNFYGFPFYMTENSEIM